VIPESNSREQLLRFLLGELSPEETSAFEQRLLADDDFADRIEEVRFDLLDAYASGELDPAIKQRVEAGLVQHEGGAVSLELARLLAGSKAASGGAPAPARPRTPGEAAARATPHAPSAWNWTRWAALAACLAMAVVGGFYLWRAHAPHPVPAAEARKPAPGAPGAASQGNQTSAAARQPAAPQAFVLLLTPRVARGPGALRAVIVPATAQTVEVQIVLAEDDPSGPYAVEIESREAGRIQSLGGLHAEAAGATRFLRIPMPAHAIRPGDYTFRLFRQGPPQQFLRTYRIHLTRAESPAPPKR
jgi:hypothetical protein